MLLLPSKAGWIVEVETDQVSKRTGRKIWKEVLCTTDQKLMNEKVQELKEQGYNVRSLEAIF